MDTPPPLAPCDDCSLHLVCRCLQVTRATVIEALTASALSTIREIRAHTGAGEGCTACHHHLEELLREYGYSSASSSMICSFK